MVIDVHTNLPRGTSPDRWDLQLVSGQNLEIQRWKDEYNPNRDNHYRWELTELPTSPGDSVYEVTCEWNGQTASINVTVHCEELVWPDGLSLGDIDDTVVSTVGATMVFTPQIIPEGWEIPGLGQQRWGFDDEAFEFADCEPVRDNDGNINDVHTLTFKKPGFFQSTYVIISGNVSVGRLVSFEIDPPEWDLVLPNDIISIEDYSFQGVSANYVYVPDGCTSIGKGAFLDSGLKLIDLPDSVSSIGEDAFPSGAIIYASEDSFAMDWGSNNGYDTAVKDVMSD